MTEVKLFGGLEVGGTKCICIIAGDPYHILDQIRIPTTSPQETLGRTIGFFQAYVSSKLINSIGIGSIGPLDTNPSSPAYGYITTTPKPGWSNTDILGILARALNVKVSLDTDVNVAALGEYKWGASRGCDPSLYLTIGTGIGGGCVINGKPHSGMLNPEMGHLRIPHDTRLDPYEGVCPFHGDCFEGLASGLAIQNRFGSTAETIPDDHPFWELEAGYMASALVNYILTLSPRKIVIGGGVMRRAFLFPIVRRKVQDLLSGYVSDPNILLEIDNYILPPGLGDRSGSLGAIALAQMMD